MLKARLRASTVELCCPDISETRGSLCQVKQVPCHSIPLCRLPASGHHMHDLAHLRHQPWVDRPAPAPACSPAVAIRHRVNRGPECVASQLGEEAQALAQALAQGAGRVSTGKMLVTGGGGYFGFRLGKELARQGMSVILLDMNKPPCDVPDGATFYQSDIRDYPSLYRVSEGVDCIFHTASYGMTGPEQLKKEQVESVNVGGTNNVINVCKERNIPRLVYTSSVNVVFVGEPIVDGDEASLPYVPHNGHIDNYSRTKAIAEKLVLSANGGSLKGGELLRTCVLRPCGIYGPEERRHLQRMMVNVQRRLFSFRFGDPKARMNWVHVDNLVLAHTLAAEALTPKRNRVASGQAYFIHDGFSVNLFEWLTPLFEKMGYSTPLIRLPLSLVYSAAILLEYLHLVLRPVITVPLLFTRTEVRSIATNHTFKIDKAHRELGYCPESYTLDDSVEHLLKSIESRSTSSLTNLLWPSQLPQLLVPLLLLLLLLLGLGLVLLMLTK